MGTALFQVSDLVKSFRSPDGDSTTTVDIPRFALDADDTIPCLTSVGIVVVGAPGRRRDKRA